MTSPPLADPEIVGHKAYVEQVFSTGDCWALALALHERYEDLTVCILTSENPDGVDVHEWIHMLVRDDRDPAGDTYVDVFGQQTAFEVLLHWDDDPDWDEIAPVEGPALEEALYAAARNASRNWPHVPIQEGINRILATGWQPPPLRQTEKRVGAPRESGTNNGRDDR